MNYLTPTKLERAAPAAARMARKPAAGLIDSAAFLDYVREELGHRPVMAIQGQPHSDPPEGQENVPRSVIVRRRSRQGRHLIVCADSTGAATILLNSHTVRRKAWIAAGFYKPKPDRFLVGVALPLQRWRGNDVAVEELERYRPMLTKMRADMRGLELGRVAIVNLARAISEKAYLPGHKPIASPELYAAFPRSGELYDILFGMLERVANGDAPAANGGRRVKQIRGPDALMHAGNAIWNVGVEKLGTIALPVYRKT